MSLSYGFLRFFVDHPNIDLRIRFGFAAKNNQFVLLKKYMVRQTMRQPQRRMNLTNGEINQHQSDNPPKNSAHRIHELPRIKQRTQRDRELVQTISLNERRGIR